MRLALDCAEQCTPTPTAFCVGCVIVARSNGADSPGVVVSTGYSRELPGNTHAEANALSKVQALSISELRAVTTAHTSNPQSIEGLLSFADVYTTMEPCSVRTSGLAPCADALIAAKVRRCIIGVGEPDDFVVCEGARKLSAAGIEVIWLKGLEDECLKVARREH
jgi:pyrimidine deaminase RibD-like protein